MHVIGTAGHVDHGKSSLVERLTGIDPDRFEEEKRRGLTIDLGFAWLELPSGAEIGIVDVPGHERFIKNMLAGAGGISICMFVVAANEGWMPQSAEHLAALEVLGVSRGVVALTKADTVDEETLEIATAEVEERMAASAMKGAPIVACSAVTGRGLPDLLAALDDVVTSTPPPPDESRPRLWVDRAFSITGAGTVVTGTLAGGTLRSGDEVEVMGPSGRGRTRRARIRSIQSHKKEVDSIGPGNRTALNLVGLERESVARGDAVVTPGQWTMTGLVDAVVQVLPEELSGRHHELVEKGSHLLYVGSAETPVRVKLLDTDIVVPGDWAFAQIRLRDPLPLRRGDRFVLRDAGRVVTFGGGGVLDPAPGPARRNDPRRLNLLRALAEADPAGALEALVDAAGSLRRADALNRSGASEVPGDLITLAGVILSRERFDHIARTAHDALAEWHRLKPLDAGMDRASLRRAVDLEPDEFDALIERMADVVEDGSLVRLESHHVVLSDDEETARASLLELIAGARFSPPLAKELDVDPQLLRALVKRGELIQIGDFYLTAESAQEARRLVRERIAANGPVTVAEIRDLLGTSRKYTVPLCEWLDQTGATLRRGDERILGPNP
jgi:selenocysteine-specific elongation factor